MATNLNNSYNNSYSKNEIIELLSVNGREQEELIRSARQLADERVGNKVYFRGLIEYSNICAKNCYYCGIRKDNRDQNRYTMMDEEVLDCARLAHEMNYGSIVIQSGERTDKAFIDKIEFLIREIKKFSDGKLGITLSLGEQTDETYKKWFDAGAHRYLLRIETSNAELYKRYHPSDGSHSYEKRLEALNLIKKTGYQLGTGVMIGLPGQTTGDLADDILFFRDFDVDMVGMGPFIEHDQTPMFNDRVILLPLRDRFSLSLNMIATLRLVMPDVNMAATTAMQAIDPEGREKAIKAGANIVMPNLTPLKYREQYLLYDGKPCLDEDAIKSNETIIRKIESTGYKIGFNEWGDSKHFLNKQF